MAKTVTMGDIAKVLNVSIVTVSKALSNKEGVSDEIRAKIKQTANDMGYRCNVAAKTLRDGLTYNVGVIIAEKFIEVGVSYYWQLYKKVADELMKLNYYAVFEILDSSDEQKASVPKMVLDNKIDGIIVLGQVSKSYYETIKKLIVPVVFMDFYEKDNSQDFIVVDNFYSMYLLTSHLIEMGHKDIGFIGNIKSTSSIQDRYLGYIKALLENNIDLNRCAKWYVSDRHDDGKYTGFDLPETLPTAFVCNCDSVAFELIDKLESENYKVPEDISIVGFDNYNFLKRNEIGITTVEVDTKAMAQTAVEILMKKINNTKVKHGISQVSSKIIFKESVKNILK